MYLTLEVRADESPGSIQISTDELDTTSGTDTCSNNLAPLSIALGNTVVCVSIPGLLAPAVLTRARG